MGLVLPSSAMKNCPDGAFQNSTEPERGVFTFEQGDQIVNLAKQSGKLMRGESLNSIFNVATSNYRHFRTQLCVVPAYPELGDRHQLDGA